MFHLNVSLVVVVVVVSIIVIIDNAKWRTLTKEHKEKHLNKTL